MVQRISLCNQAFWADTHRYNHKDTNIQRANGPKDYFMWLGILGLQIYIIKKIQSQWDESRSESGNFPMCTWIVIHHQLMLRAEENIMQKKLLRCKYLLNFDDKIMHMIRMHVMPFVIRMYVWYVSVCFFGVLRYLSLIAILTTTGDQITHLALVQRPIL